MISIDVQSRMTMCLANSQRWFPELHERGTLATAVHFALGLAGEIGELLEALDHPIETLKFHAFKLAILDEAADVAIYTLDLAGQLRCPLPLVDPHVEEATAIPGLVIDASRAVDLVKKVNRAADPWAELDLRRPQLTIRLAHVLYRVDQIVFSVDGELADAIDAKAAVCEERWGSPA